MITMYLYDSFSCSYTNEEKKHRFETILQAEEDGYTIKWNDHQTWMWATIEFESDVDAVEFKLKYL